MEDQELNRMEAENRLQIINGLLYGFSKEPIYWPNEDDPGEAMDEWVTFYWN